MKKSLIALAAVAAAGGACAQSSVTLYGRADANVTYTKSGDLSPERGDSVVKLNDGGPTGLGGSRWGLRGTEDLGGGLRAYFVLEQGYNIDTGTPGSATQLFNRQAYVALGSSWGDLRLGRVETLTRELNVGIGDVTSEGEITIVDPAFPANRPLFQNLGTRVSNAVEYRSPVLSGFQVIGLVGAGEGAPNARHQGISATYRGGALAIGLAYEGYDNGTTYNDVVTLGANYKFGFATVYAAYQQTSDFGTQAAFTPGTDVDAYSLGVLVPFGNWQARAQYIQSTIDVPGTAPDLDNRKFGASLRYALSKRTSVYVAATSRTGDVADSLSRKTEYVAGVGHNF